MTTGLRPVANQKATKTNLVNLAERVCTIIFYNSMLTVKGLYPIPCQALNYIREGVSTNGDECSHVGLEISTSSKCEAYFIR